MAVWDTSSSEVLLGFSVLVGSQEERVGAYIIDYNLILELTRLRKHG